MTRTKTIKKSSITLIAMKGLFIFNYAWLSPKIGPPTFLVFLSLIIFLAVGIKNLSKPKYVVPFQANNRITARIKNVGFVLIVPAHKKFKFIRPAAINAGIVSAPTINPMPTNNSPQATSTLNNFAFGIATVSRNAPYQA